MSLPVKSYLRLTCLTLTAMALSPAMANTGLTIEVEGLEPTTTELGFEIEDGYLKGVTDSIEHWYVKPLKKVTYFAKVDGGGSPIETLMWQIKLQSANATWVKATYYPTGEPQETADLTWSVGSKTLFNSFESTSGAVEDLTAAEHAYSFSFKSTQSTPTYVMSYQATNEAGETNASEQASISRILTVDGTEPTTTVALTKSESEVVVSITASDAASGLAAEAYSFDDGVTWQASPTHAYTRNGTLWFRTRDNVGNERRQGVVITEITQGEPIVIITTTGTDSIMDTQVSLKLSDQRRLPLDATPYSFDGGQTWQATNAGYFRTNQHVEVAIKTQAGEIGFASYDITNLDETPPRVEVTGNATEWTNQNVTLTVKGEDDGIGLAYRPYSFNRGSFQATPTITATTNQTVNVRVIDERSNLTSVDVVVDKIDKEGPSLTVSGNPQAYGGSPVVLKAEATDSKSGLAEEAYSFDGAVTWQKEPEKAFYTNQNVPVWVRDSLGNISSQKVVINKIDTVIPTFTVSGNPLGWRAEDVTITLVGSDLHSGLHAIPYSWDGGLTWTSENSKTFSENQTIEVAVRDKANLVRTETVAITKIDKTPPTVTYTLDPSEWTNQNVVVTAFVTDAESGPNRAAYSWGNNEWEGSLVYKTVSSNQTVSFKGRDAVGHITSAEFIVDNIDKEVPTFTVSGNPLNWTNENVTLVVTAFDSLSGIASTGYSFDNGKTWQAEPSASFETNQSVTIKVRDVAGNLATAQTITINKIDKTPPTIQAINGLDVIQSDDTIRVSPVAVDAQSGLSSPPYSLDGFNWVEATDLILLDNGEYTLSVRDNAGNISSQPFEVTAFHTEPPEISLSADHGVTDWANERATITAQLTSPVGIEKTKFHNDLAVTHLSRPKTLTLTFEVDEPNYYYLEAWDKRGNYGEVYLFVQYLDKTTPHLEIISSHNEWTNQAMSLTIQEVSVNTP